MLSLQVRREVSKLVPSPVRAELKRQLQRAMRAAAVEYAMVSLTLSTDEELHELNRTYADEDHATDVLSFAQQELVPGQPRPSNPALPPELLGDIIISVPIATRQAHERSHDLQAELVHLAVHGLCHLLGYDHATPAQEQVMFGYEALLRFQAAGQGRLQRQPAPPMPKELAAHAQ